MFLLAQPKLGSSAPDMQTKHTFVKIINFTSSPTIRANLWFSFLSTADVKMIFCKSNVWNLAASIQIPSVQSHVTIQVEPRRDSSTGGLLPRTSSAKSSFSSFLLMTACEWQQSSVDPSAARQSVSKRESLTQTSHFRLDVTDGRHGDVADWTGLTHFTAQKIKRDTLKPLWTVKCAHTVNSLLCLISIRLLGTVSVNVSKYYNLI